MIQRLGTITQFTIIWGVGALFGGPLTFASDPADSVLVEYERRLAELASDDLEGHLRLALWCEDQEAYDLLRKQCLRILAQDAGHEQARLLLELARRHLGGSEDGSGGAGRADPQAPGGTAGGLGRIISDAEVRRIRWIELREDEPRPPAIQFNNRIIQRFLEAMAERQGYSTPDERRTFMRLKPWEKAWRIRIAIDGGLVEAALAEDIHIHSDPQRMAEFSRHVLKPVLAGCATAHCHGNPSVSRFTLYTDRVMSTNTVYTNYLIMHGYRAGPRRLINRDVPDESLLITYGLRELPAGMDRSFKHPTVDAAGRPLEINHLYRGPSDPILQAVRDWLVSLSALEPDYAIALEPAVTGP